jgi:hypothetical protein
LFIAFSATRQLQATALRATLPDPLDRQPDSSLCTNRFISNSWHFDLIELPSNYKKS